MEPKAAVLLFVFAFAAVATFVTLFYGRTFIIQLTLRSFSEVPVTKDELQKLLHICSVHVIVWVALAGVIVVAVAFFGAMG